MEPPHRGSRGQRASGATPQMQPALPPGSSKSASLCACAWWGWAGRRQAVGSDGPGNVAAGAASPGEQGHARAVLREHKRLPQEETAALEPADRRAPLGTPGHCPHLLPPHSFVKVCRCLFWRRSRGLQVLGFSDIGRDTSEPFGQEHCPIPDHAPASPPSGRLCLH